MNFILPAWLNLSQRLITRLLYISYAILFAIIAINSQSFPYFGWAIIGISLPVIVWRFKTVQGLGSQILIAIAIFNGLTFGIRTDSLILFFAFVSWVYCLCWAILPEFDKRFRNNLGFFLFAPLLIMIILFDQPRPKAVMPVKNEDRNGDTVVAATKVKTYNRDYSGVVVGVILTFFILLVVVPLLYFSNPIFGSWVDNFFKFWNFGWLVDLFSRLGWLADILREIFNWYFFLRVLIFSLVWFFLPRIIKLVGFGDFDSYEAGSYRKPRTLALLAEREAIRREALTLKSRTVKTSSTANLIWLIPKIAIGVIVGLFILAQLQLYLSTSDGLVKLGYNLSKYSNEVFFQLSVVSTIIISILYFDLRKTKFSSYVSIALLAQVTLLSLFGLRSVWVYISTQGFTQKRLYGIFVVIFLLGLVGYFGQRLYKNVVIQLRTITIWLALILTLIAGINFNYIIYHLNPKYDQASYTGSSSWNANWDTGTDSLSTGQRLAKIMDIYRKYNQDGQVYYRCSEITENSQLASEIQDLQKESNLLGFNLARAIAKAGIKKEDLELFEKITLGNTSYRDSYWQYDVRYYDRNNFENIKKKKSINLDHYYDIKIVKCADYTIEKLLEKEKSDYKFYADKVSVQIQAFNAKIYSSDQDDNLYLINDLPKQSPVDKVTFLGYFTYEGQNFQLNVVPTNAFPITQRIAVTYSTNTSEYRVYDFEFTQVGEDILLTNGTKLENSKYPNAPKNINITKLSPKKTLDNVSMIVESYSADQITLTDKSCHKVVYFCSTSYTFSTSDYLNKFEDRAIYSEYSTKINEAYNSKKTVKVSMTIDSQNTGTLTGVSFDK